MIMVHTIKRVSQVDFVKAGYLAGAMDFKTQELGIADAKKAVSFIRSYNNFESARVNRAIDLLKNDIGGIQVGREHSPVLYIHFPYWTGQKAVHRARKGSGVRIPDSVTASGMDKAKKLFKDARADEIDAEDDHTLRVWWD